MRFTEIKLRIAVLPAYLTPISTLFVVPAWIGKKGKQNSNVFRVIETVFLKSGLVVCLFTAAKIKTLKLTHNHYI